MRRLMARQLSTDKIASTGNADGPAARQDAPANATAAKSPASAIRPDSLKLMQGDVPKLLINCLPNNIFITCTRTVPSHRLLFKLSSGLVGARNAAKTAPKTVMLLIDAVKARLKELGGGDVVRVDFRGITRARSVLVSQLRRMGIGITEIGDSTGIPFNGCRPKKSRRL